MSVFAPGHAARAAIPPTFIQEAETVWNTSTNPKTTASFSIQTGDVLVAFAMMENGPTGATISISNSDAALTWAQQVYQPGVGDNTRSYLSIWTATGDSSRSLTVTFTRNGAGTQHFGGNVLLFRNSLGVGAVASTNNGTGSGAPSVNITTTKADSAIVVANADWNATDGASRTWLSNAGTLTEQTYVLDSGRYSVYGGYHADAGAIGTYAVGLSAPSTQRYVLGAIEVWGLNTPGVQVTSRSDTLSDSRPSATSNHTIAFTINNSLDTTGWGSGAGGDATDTVTVAFPSSFNLANIFCKDVDISFGGTVTSIAGYNVNRSTRTNCPGSATSWGLFIDSSGESMTFYTPTAVRTYVATGTQVQILIGTNASFQDAATKWITNPSTAGIYTISVGGTFGGSGNILVSINSAVSLQLTVAESLSFSVASVAAGSCTADDGATVTAIDTSSISVPFGNLFPANTFFFGCQDLVVSTNAGGGYSLTVQEQTLLQSPGGFSIPQTTCDASACTLTTAAAWTNANNNGFGHTCRNQTNHDCAATYSSGSNFRPTANVVAGDAAQTIMSSSTPASATGRIKYRVSSGSSQPAGDYKTIITYTITPTY